MVSETLHVTCPHCGSVMATATEPTATTTDRLKGIVESCTDCESPFDLYYY
ncbi:MAG: hypothetical protein M8354_03385 [Halalkalicoccus sp.]|nr:hypothetical protein [Halalkalicoccus sp.]